MEIFKFSWQFIKNYLTLFAIIVLINIIGTSSSIYMTYITGEYIDFLIAESVVNTVIKYGVIFLIISIISILCSCVSNVLLCKLITKTSFNMQDYIIEHIKKLPINFFDNKDTVYITDRVTKDCKEIVDFTLNNFFACFINILSLCIYTILLVYIDYKVLIFLGVIIPIYCIVYKFFKVPLYKNNYKYKEDQNKFYTKTNNQIRNICFIKSHSLFNVVRKEYTNYFLMTYTSAIKSMTTYSNFIFWGSLIKTVMSVCVFFYAGFCIISNTMTIGRFIIINRYLSKVLVSIQFFLNYTTTYQNTKASYSRIKEIINQPIEHNGTKIVTKINNIVLNKITFSYKDKVILKNFDFEFEKGKIYGVIGPNGTGKSTLINILLGIIQNYDGKITYDGEDISSLDLYNLRKQKVSIVDQSPMFASDTISENIYSSNFDVNMNTIISLFNDYNINYFITNQNKISDRNIDLLSGGEMQKISLIRSILKKPDLFILDEPTTYLDSKSVLKLREHLELISNDTIIIVITHDEIFLEIADEILDLSRKNINSLEVIDAI